MLTYLIGFITYVMSFITFLDVGFGMHPMVFPFFLFFLFWWSPSFFYHAGSRFSRQEHESVAFSALPHAHQCLVIHLSFWLLRLKILYESPGMN